MQKKCHLWAHLRFDTLIGNDFKTCVIGVEFYLRLREIGRIKREQTLLIVFLRIALRQHEGFGEMAFVIDAGQIQTAVIAIIPTAGEDYPTRVRRPIMIAICLRTVDLRQFTSSSRL